MHIVDEPRKFSPSNVLTYTVRPMDWKLISATVTIRVSRPRVEWLVALRIT